MKGLVHPAKGGLSELKKVLRMAVLNKDLLKENRPYLLFVWPSGSGVSGFDVERISSIWCYCLHLVEVMFTMCCYLQHLVLIGSTMCCCFNDLAWAISTMCCYLHQLVVGKQAAGLSSPPMVPHPPMQSGLEFERNYSILLCWLHNLVVIIPTMCCYLQHLVAVASSIWCCLHHVVVVSHIMSCYLQHIAVVIYKMCCCFQRLALVMSAMCCCLQQFAW